jgi:hypothetical protein
VTADGTKSRGHGDKRPHKLDLFIASLLASKSVESAAAAAGIGTRTAWRWMADANFRRRLAEARRDALERAMTRLQESCTRAAINLDELQQSAENESVRLSASRCILELALRSAELQDVQERLSALEQIAQRRLKGQDHDQPAGHTPIGSARRVNGRE